MGTENSAQKFIEVMGFHYNFCREHSALGTTPSEAAGLKLQLGKDKIESLIRISSLV